MVLAGSLVLPTDSAAAPQAAEGPSAAAQDSTAEDSTAEDGPPPLQFVAEPAGEAVDQLEISREGYATLIWVPDPGADGYRVVDDSGRTVYEGRIPQAFVSGLGDGTHRFRVVSLDERGEVLREGPQAVTLTVEHWSLWLTWTLFGVGAAVMVALVAVLVIGSREQRKAVNR